MANIFTIKIGSPDNMSNSPLLEGELGFHIKNNTLYIGNPNGMISVGGAGAFVPWNNADENKTLFLSSLTLKNPLAIECGGTGVTKLSDLTFTKDQIIDLDLSNYLTEVNWSEVGFEKNGEDWSLDISSLKIDGKDVATQEWVGDQGYLTSVPEVNLNNYLPLTGGTITNSLTIQNQLFLTNDLTHTVNSGAVRHLFSSTDNADNLGQIYYYGSSSFFGFQVTNARGTNGANARIMYLCSEKDQSSLNNFIRINNITDGTNHYYDVYHSGWSGTMSFPTDISVVNTIQVTKANDVAIKFIKGSQNSSGKYTGNYIEANSNSFKIWSEVDYQDRTISRRGLEVYNQLETANDGDALVFSTCDNNGYWNNYKIYHEGNLDISNLGSNYKIAYGSTTINTSTDVTISYSNAGFTSTPYITASYSTTGSPGSGDNGAIKIHSKTRTSAKIIVGGNTLTDGKIDWIAIGV